MEQSFTLAQLTGTRHRRTGRTVLLLVAALALAAVAAGVTYAATRPAPVLAHVAVFASPTPASPTPDRPTLDERAACVAVVPLFTDAADLLTALGADNSGRTVDGAKLDATIATLDMLAPVMPAAMRGDVTDMLAVLKNARRWIDGKGATLRFSDAADATLNVAARCSRYAG